MVTEYEWKTSSKGEMAIGSVYPNSERTKEVLSITTTSDMVHHHHFSYIVNVVIGYLVGLVVLVIFVALCSIVVIVVFMRKWKPDNRGSESSTALENVKQEEEEQEDRYVDLMQIQRNKHH